MPPPIVDLPPPTPAATPAATTSDTLLSATARLDANADAATTRALSVELALASPERQRGLMNRPALATDAGMLFVFEDLQPLSFWMKDTSIALSIAFLNRDGAIINIEPLQPFSLDSVSATERAQYALEVNRGYFADNGIAAGAQVALTECPTRVDLLRRAPQKVVAAVLRLCR